MATGCIRWFDDVRGFGFLRRDGDGEDVLFHYTTVEGHARAPVALGQLVVFEVFDQVAEVPVAGDVRRVPGERDRFALAPAGDAVLLRAIPRRPSLQAMAERLRPHGEVRATDLQVRLRAPPHELTLFDDGSAIVLGAGGEVEARRLAAGWLGVRIPD